MIGLLWIAVAVAAPEDALNPVLATLYSEARQDEAAGRYREAAAGYTVVLRGDPWFRPATLDLGRVLERQGKVDDALATYASRSDDLDAVEARARLLLDIGDSERVRPLIERLKARSNRPEWRILEARRVASSSPEEALELLAAYLEFYGASIDDSGFDIAWSAALNTLPDPSTARPHLDAWLASFPEARTAPALATARRDLEIDGAARALAASGADPLGPAEVHRLVEAREAFADREYDRAASLLTEVLRVRPRSAVAWATLSDVRAAQGDLTASVEAIDAAIEIAPLDADALVRRGERLLDFGGRLDHEAVEAFRRAADRRPTDASIWLKKARAERNTGQWRQAVASYREVVRLDPAGALAREAANALGAAERPLPEARERLPPRGRPVGVSEAAWTAYFRAWAWREHRPATGVADPTTRTEAAQRAWEEVQRARQLAPDFAPAINLEATLLADRGRMEQAIALLRESLARDAGQAETWLTLARVLEERAEPGSADALARAADLGHPIALWRRARDQADRGLWWQARNTLDAYFAATTHGPHYAKAEQLHDRLDRRIRWTLTLAGLTLILGTLIPIGARAWARSGVGLDVVVDRAPRQWPAIARILAAIRHEVLKHHTSVLPSVAKALEQGRDAPAHWVADRLFGPRGALARLDRYLRELQAIARAHETRLNLRFGDRELGALVRSAERLRQLQSELRAPTDRHRLADALRDVARVLHEQVYPALGRRIAALASLRLTPAALTHLVSDVAEESAFADVDGRQIEVRWPPQPVHVRIDPGDLIDLVANLVRNALAASCALPDGPQRRIAVHGTLEADSITGLEQVAIAVCDHHPQPLTTAMVRGRYIARGLGIAGDLATRAGGSITVEEGPDDYHKAVVVRLPAVEPPEEAS